MNKIFTYILLVTAACLMFPSCVVEELYSSENLLMSEKGDSGQTEELTYLEAAVGDMPTKTVMSAFDGSWKTLWQSEDKIAVFFDGSSSAVDFSLEKGEGQNVGVFFGNANGKVWTALYPAMDAMSKNGNCIDLELPETQTYAKGSFGPDSYPMVAAPTSGTMQFKNLCSTIKVQLKGHHVVDSVRFTASDRNISVCGPASVDVSFTKNPVLTMKSGGSGSVTLDVGGVMIDPDEITDFYIVLPAQTYRGGFTLKIFTPTGSMTRSTDADVTIERSKVHALTPFYVKLDEGLDPSVALEGSGTEVSPLLIKNLPDLLTMISSVNDNTNVRNSEGQKIDATTAVFKLENDIDLSPVCSKSGKSWTPIGGETPFSGVFDGNGHKLSNLYIDTDKPKAGLFGYLSGTVRNLTVSGTVTSSNRFVGMIAGCPKSFSLIENCTTYGEVTSSYNGNYSEVGGIAGGVEESGARISDCRNYATVEGYDCIGGIVGYAFFFEIDRCINFGSIKFFTYGGGLAGFSQDGLIYNCSNCGDIEGADIVGGICGGVYNNSKIANCINSGEVYAEQGDIGGIFGYYSGDDGQHVQNCVNVGNILTPKSFNGNKGGIAGASMSEVQNCYWLYDAQAKLGIKEGIALGNEAFCFALTADQINGIQSFTEPLYYSKEGIPSINSLNALNNWATDNSDEYQYWGWTFNEGDDWLSFTGQPAKAEQGDVSDIFIVSPSELSISYEENYFEVKVVAGMGHKLSSMPDWISVSDTRVAEAGGITTTMYTFNAQSNPDYVKRTGVIVLCNDAQQCVPITVEQMEKIDEDDIWKIKNFYHRSVGFRFTATWCPYSPAMSEEWDYAKKILGDKFQIAAFHPTSSDLGFSETPKRELTYNVTKYPSGIIDGRANVYGGTSIGPVTEETAKAYGTSSGIEFVSTVNGNTINLDIRLYIHKKGDYKVTALLLEDNIISGQQDERYGYRSDFRHDNIVRLAFSEVTGDKFTLNSDNSIMPFTYSGEIPYQCRKENLRILVFVERAYGDLQKVNAISGVTYLDFTDYFVDNANTAALGQKAGIDFDDGTGKDDKYESVDYSADGKVTKLQSASVGNGIDIVITGDAFADKDQTSFEAYADRAMEAFFAVEPYNSLRNRFNVWRINAVSKNDYIGGDTKFSVKTGDNTYVEGNSDNVFSFVEDNLLSVDFTKTLIIVLANKAVYAGTCFSWKDNSAISYVPLQTSLSEFDATLRHESAGHGFGKLDDEYCYEGIAPSDWIEDRKYWQTSAYGFWENIDFTDSPELIRWKTFLNDDRYSGQVGIFEGGGTYASGVWRSTENSIMRYNRGYFNAPSREAIYKKIMRFSEGDSWTYDYEKFVEFDAKGRREESAHSYTYNKAYGAPNQKKAIPLHPPVLMEK